MNSMHYITNMVRHPSKRQRAAEEQLAILDELDVEQFAQFLNIYAQYIPYRTLWRAIGTNGKLIKLFDQFATNAWWKDRVKNDFYDYYNAIVVTEDYEFHEKIHAWMVFAISSNASQKPWRLVYMSCYGIFNLLNASKSPFKNDGNFTVDDFVGIGEIERMQGTHIFGDFFVTQTETEVIIKSWITGETLKTFPKENAGNVIAPVLNGIVLYETNSAMIYDRDNDTVTKTKEIDRMHSPRSRYLGDLLYRPPLWNSLRHRKDIASLIKVSGKYHFLGQDYYGLDNEVYQWPKKLYQIIDIPPERSLKLLLGPYNFNVEKFSPIFFNNTTRIFETQENGNVMSLTNDISRDDEIEQFGYGFITLNDTKTRIHAPSGRHITIDNTIRDIAICGPFAIIDVGGVFRKVDLWETLQNAMHERFTLSSNEHCHNCGFIAQMKCDLCTGTFCDIDCAKEHFENPCNTITCKHGSN